MTKWTRMQNHRYNALLGPVAMARSIRGSVNAHPAASDRARDLAHEIDELLSLLDTELRDNKRSSVRSLTVEGSTDSLSSIET